MVMMAATNLFRNLSRDARDTLFILAVVGWTVVPHVGNLPPWSLPLAAVLLLWRSHLALTDRPLPRRWILVTVLALSMVLTVMSYQTLLGKQAGVAILVTLIGLKTLEMRARRDAFVIFFLGFFLVLTHFFYSQSIGVALAMVISVWGLLTALVLMHMPVGQPALKKAAGISARTALLGAPIMVILFVLFPRLPPLWGVPQDGISSTGLSDRLHMGSIAELAMSNEIVMRIRFPKGAPKPSDLYFRGPVLSQFDGTVWSPSTNLSADQEIPPARPQGAPLAYEITLEPHRSREIPLLEFTAEVPQTDAAGEGLGSEIYLTQDLRWRSRQPVFDRQRLQLAAFTTFQHGPTQFVPSLEEHRQLPSGHSPRTVAWAKQLLQRPDLSSGDTRLLANAVFEHIRQENFHYTLTPGTYGDDNPTAAVDEFWLDRRQGFCEHFATAFVVVMRALGVPARIVTGFQGADPRPVDGYYIVRKNSAHAWAEYWVRGNGWVRADPTAYVAPERIHLSANLAAPPGFVAGTLREAFGGTDVFGQWRLAWEAMNNRWNQWVMNYSRGQQLDLLRNLGFSNPDWQHLGMLLFFITGGSILSIWIYGRWRSATSDPWGTQMKALRKDLRRLGLEPSEHTPPLTLSRMVQERLGHTGQPLAHGLVELDASRYGRQASLREIRRHIRKLRTTARDLARSGAVAAPRAR